MCACLHVSRRCLSASCVDCPATTLRDPPAAWRAGPYLDHHLSLTWTSPRLLSLLGMSSPCSNTISSRSVPFWAPVGIIFSPQGQDLGWAISDVTNVLATWKHHPRTGLVRLLSWPLNVMDNEHFVVFRQSVIFSLFLWLIQHPFF